MGVYRVKVRKNPSKNKEIYLDKGNDNKQELYLNDVYEKECEFKVKKEEVEFIHVAIENLMTKVAVWILDYLKELTLNENVDKGLCKILKNRDETACPCEIIGVGSFYEGTRNGFPDEFDFIFPLYCSESSNYYNEQDSSVTIPASELFKDFSWVLKGLSHVTINYKEILQYESFDRKSRVIFDQYMDVKGPASKLQFIYSCSSSDHRNISVDFVPAIKVFGNTLKPMVDATCKLREFRTEILKTGEYLLVNQILFNISFTTTELQFMRTVLSKNHKKVFQILKYLINGHDADEKLKKYLHTMGSVKKMYSSYMIKTMMTRHHYICTNTTTDKIGPCILQVLDTMSEYTDIENCPFLTQQRPEIQQRVSFDPSTRNVTRNLFSISNMIYPLPLVPYLQSISVYLRLMQTSNCVDYDYEKDKLKLSASQMYLDDLVAGLVFDTRPPQLVRMFPS